jgi:hypothetical protein
VTPLALNQFLTLYSWFPLAALLGFLLLIARFYQKFSGKRTYFHWLIVPVVAFGVASVRYAGLNRLTGDWVADLLLAVGGITLVMFSLHLGRTMLKQREETSG